MEDAVKLPQRPLETWGERVRRHRVFMTRTRLAQTWRPAGRRYRTGADQVRADPEHEHRGNESGCPRHLDFPILVGHS